jgi:diguanylate cyclase (GGDEF)-like protein
MTASNEPVSASRPPLRRDQISASFLASVSELGGSEQLVGALAGGAHQRRVSRSRAMPLLQVALAAVAVGVYGGSTTPVVTWLLVHVVVAGYAIAGWILADHAGESRGPRRAVALGAWVAVGALLAVSQQHTGIGTWRTYVVAGVYVLAGLLAVAHTYRTDPAAKPSAEVPKSQRALHQRLAAEAEALPADRTDASQVVNDPISIDALTGLPNRELFLNQVQEAVSSGAENGATVGVLIMELDDFKVVNDTLGHSAGDALLVAVGNRLTEALRAVDGSYGAAGTVARLGGDEFAALVRRAGSAADVERVAEKVLASFATPFELPHGDVTATASIGVATTAEAADAQDLLRHADLAVYVAKDAGKDRWRRYESSLHSAVVERHKLRADLDRAIADGAFLLHFQPIVAISDGRTHGFEALVRWNHPTRGMVSPAEFISVADESGLIVPLGAWVLRNAVEAAAQWRLLHPGEDVYVSVNVSAREFRGREQGFARWVLAEIDRMGLPPASLLLEMTESLLLHDDGDVTDELAALRAAGVRIAIDDFGTGFSSLSYLRRLPVDVLKLDKSFIDTIASSAEQHAVVDMIVQLAAILQLQVVAEGIETPAERDLLLAMGCHFGQGYLFSRPLSFGDARQWLMEETSGLQRGSRTAVISAESAHRRAS